MVCTECAIYHRIALHRHLSRQQVRSEVVAHSMEVLQRRTRVIRRHLHYGPHPLDFLKIAHQKYEDQLCFSLIKGSLLRVFVSKLRECSLPLLSR